MDDFRRSSLGHGLSTDFTVVYDSQAGLLPHAVGVRRSLMSVMGLKTIWNTKPIRIITKQ